GGVRREGGVIAATGRRVRPPPPLRKPPLLPPLGNQGTSRGPMRRLYDMADERGKDTKAVSISIFAAFPPPDIPDAGFGIYVVTDGDQALADRLADQLADTAWTHRHEFIHTALPVREAGAKAPAPEAH